MEMALPMDQLVDAWRAAQTAPHGTKQQVLREVCDRLGTSLQTLYREFERVGLQKARKRRTDAGNTTLTRDEMLDLAAFFKHGFRNNKKKLPGMDDALTVLRENQPGFACRTDESTGELVPLSASACSRALRAHGFHYEQLNRPTPSQGQRSRHPNHVWEIDASISTLFYVPEGGLADMSPAVFYKNKPGNFEKIKRQRLTRYVITDHTTGAIFCWYVAGGESIANLAESFLEAMREKPGEAVYGVPFKLYFDPGSAATKTFKRFLMALDVKPVVHGVQNSRATGQVENAHNLVETKFEMGFKYTHVPNIAWINDKARKWCKYFNATLKHGRHGMTRLNAWLHITAEQLRLVDVDLARELLTREPEQAKVQDNLRIRFKSQVWDVSQVPGVMIGEKLSVTVNPLAPNRAWVVTYVDGQETLHPISCVQLTDDPWRFEATAPEIGEEFKAVADTQLDKNRKEVMRHIYDVDTDEAVAAAIKAKAVPFGGRIDPYKHLDNLPDVAVLPKRGTVLDVAQSSRIAEVPLSHPEAALRLKALLADWSAKDYATLTRWYPDGVPEQDLTAIAQRLRTSAIAGGERSC